MEFDGDSTPIIVGSALNALNGDSPDKFGRQSILDLVQAIDEYITVSYTIIVRSTKT